MNIRDLLRETELFDTPAQSRIDLVSFASRFPPRSGVRTAERSEVEVDEAFLHPARDDNSYADRTCAASSILMLGESRAPRRHARTSVEPVVIAACGSLKMTPARGRSRLATEVLMLPASDDAELVGASPRRLLGLRASRKPIRLSFTRRHTPAHAFRAPLAT